MRALALVAILSGAAGTAAADAPASNKLGFRISFGRLTAFDARQSWESLGLGIEHPLCDGVRIFGEYEWVSFGLKDSTLPGDKGMPGDGHRAGVGLRGELLGTTVGGHIHFFADGEAGASLAVLADNHDRVAIQPAAFAGLRLGYDFLWGRPPASSRVFEAELLARYQRMPDGANGVMIGVGMLWGD